MGDWTFFSNYGHVLVCLARNREARLRDVAADVGITERAVQKIVRDMQDAGFITITKQGRCNRYRINRRKSLRHGLESHCTVGKLLRLVARPGTEVASADTPADAPAAVPADVPAEAAAEESPKREKEPAPARARKPDRTDKPAREEPGGDQPAGTDVRQQGSLF